LVQKILKPKKIKSKKIEHLKNIKQVVPGISAIHSQSSGFISQDKEIVVPSIDKFITGISAPGSTTMVIGTTEEKENPVYMYNLDRRLNI